jgi:hypothetical protein
MQAVRETATTNQTVSIEWAASVKSRQDFVASRIRRMLLKDEPIVTREPMT